VEPVFLRLDQVLELHQDQIGRYGGSHGLRDMGLLQSALAQPAATFGGTFLYRDLFEMAAAYLHGLVSNHPFVDGNKRVGAAATVVFLYVNGFHLEVAEPALVKLVLNVATGKADKGGLAEFLRQHSRKA
jgi:death-on-curing protein